MVDVLEGYRLSHVDVLSLGVDGQTFHPARRDPGLRRELGLPETGPLLIYAGRIDNEKRADLLIAMFRALPASLGASLVMLGDGKLRETLMEAAQGLPVAFPGYVGDRAEIARMLASADIYVSCMADETFGLSVLEAQASGLPVVGFASGAMVQRVPPALGKLVTLDDTAAMAQAVVDVWQGDRVGMGQRAREHVTTQFSWKQTFETLLGEVYPRALATSAARVAALGGVRWRGDDRTCAARQYRT